MGKDWDNPNTFPMRDRGERLTGSGNPTASRGFANGITLDSSKRGREAFISFLTSIMREALRVLRPGGHAFVWALPRTSHWTAMALEDAGFEIRDVLAHLFGSGFPKSHNISAAIDKHLHAERKVVGMRTNGNHGGGAHTYDDDNFVWPKEFPVTAPATPEAAQWSGYGSALKPSHENWILCRKPLAEKSIAENVLTWGVGGLAIDKCRIAAPPMTRPNGKPEAEGWGLHKRTEDWTNTSGRFPSNTLLSHSLFCSEAGCADGCPVKALDEMSGIRKSNARPNCFGKQYESDNMRTHGKYGATTYHAHDDTGTASRYFAQFSPDVPFIYAAKASRAERNKGCEGLPEQSSATRNTSERRFNPICDNTGKRIQVCRCGACTWSKDTNPISSNSHPTIKSQQLMRYLVRMITPPNGVVLDMFAGSGSTLVAAIHEGMHFIGIEQSNTEAEPYIDICNARIAQAYKDCGVEPVKPEKKSVMRKPRKKATHAGLWEVTA